MVYNLNNKKAYHFLISRIEKIDSKTIPQWGTMNPAQMMAHCAEIQEATNGKKINSPFFLKLFMPIIKKMVVNGKYKKNTKTHPAFKQINVHGFDEEKKRLLTALKIFYLTEPSQMKLIKHSFFGFMTNDEKGQAMYKHLDYHLKQFGILL